ncbi:hypothetical protein H9L10_10685 [Phycicoccus endophyticus]|uniref:WXG100 family type VII secretion target n=1 Tax=Phycicoccus endophyticus TaxID=1690220 RepID=A0A7G9QZI3_9MICO|nr:hypothetical protein [Phycicoccus endophyticus]NHI19122.1 hypothetical protein [Phycicoccus endophyticus]QNN48758.1 hypothetical protein H9L10_10685 [Phycicoccus endophyticus]GGL32954.1 hypothetical protein GCM10012283_14220 [Phycicoccus endophyticus]
MEAVELERLAARVEAAAEVVALRRASLGRAATAWWEGPAADRYRAAVEDRSARLAALQDELGWLGASVRALARAVAEASGDEVGRAS